MHVCSRRERVWGCLPGRGRHCQAPGAVRVDECATSDDPSAQTPGFSHLRDFPERSTNASGDIPPFACPIYLALVVASSTGWTHDVLILVQLIHCAASCVSTPAPPRPYHLGLHRGQALRPRTRPCSLVVVRRQIIPRDPCSHHHVLERCQGQRLQWPFAPL